MFTGALRAELRRLGPNRFKLWQALWKVCDLERLWLVRCFAQVVVRSAVASEPTLEFFASAIADKFGVSHSKLCIVGEFYQMTVGIV